MLVGERLRKSDLCSGREGATEMGPFFPGQEIIPEVKSSEFTHRRLVSVPVSRA